MGEIDNFRVCVITDNEYLLNAVLTITERNKWSNFKFFYSDSNHEFAGKYANNDLFRPINLKTSDDLFFSQYDVFLSLHCKQLFPERLVKNYRCINVHPGFNPYNRGWYPQAFSIINHLPAGVTIHEIDEQLDHGPVIMQKQVAVSMHDTSYDIYHKIMSEEKKLLELYLEDLITARYHTFQPDSEGNVNLKKDFQELCKLNREQYGTFGEFIDLLRAVTFPGYKNAYFYGDDGKKIYVEIKMEREA